MKNFQVSTDSSCDMNLDYFFSNGVDCIHMNYAFDMTEQVDTSRDDDKMTFLNKMRAGSVARSTQVTPEAYLEHWEKMLENSPLPILHITLSSGLSGTYANGVTAREVFLQKHPDAQIFVSDSMSATQGIGFQVHHAVQMRDEGKSFEEAVEWAKFAGVHTNAFFTVEDLIYLKRGGRISPTSAWIGTLLSIKPVLHVNAEGKLAVLEKAKGRKRAIQRLADYVAQSIENPEDQLIHISHADCLDDANALAEILKKTVNPKGFFIGLMGPIIAAHAGPGTLAIFFLGKERVP